MTEYACTHERFAHDTATHAMTVVRANGVERHIRFKKPGTNSYWFDLITWPGTLCIDGDCGTYVFRRITDMFEFFRNDCAYINPSYWAEKCVSAGKRGVTEFDWDTFVKNVSSYIEDEDEVMRRDVMAALDGVVEDEFGATTFIREFEHDGFRFQDWETDCREYTFHFTWCLRAIVWGIAKWDAERHVHGTAA